MDGTQVQQRPESDRPATVHAVAADVLRRLEQVTQKARYRSQAGEGSLHLSDTRVAEDPAADCHGGNQFVAAVVALHERGRPRVLSHVDQSVSRAGEP